MTFDEALEIFENWYESCIESGISPEEVVAKVGGMALITDEEVIERLEESGEI